MVAVNNLILNCSLINVKLNQSTSVFNDNYMYTELHDINVLLYIYFFFTRFYFPIFTNLRHMDSTKIDHPIFEYTYHIIISMTGCKTAVSPLIMHWR